MKTTDDAAPLPALIRSEWTTFRNRGRMLAMAATIVVTILLGLSFAILLGSRTSCSNGPVEVPCPADPTSSDGRAVTDTFYFVHRPLGENGSITTRLTSMSGIITYPPPDHDEIVPGLVPWAKAGVIVKDGTAQGSPYAALMVTGGHGVRMQHNFINDVAGRAADETPTWLRLTRAGGTISGFESADGTQWTEVGSVHLPGLPETVQVGLFVASPGDLTLRSVALGAQIPESRFTQATAVFDNTTVDNTTVDGARGGWNHGSVGDMGHTDWERYHRPPGLVETDGTFTVTGTGDIGPAGAEGGHTVTTTLLGLTISLVIVLVVAARFVTVEYRGGAALTGRALVAKAVVSGSVTFVAGLIAAVIVVPVGTAILRANDISVVAVSVPTGLRVVVGVAALLAVVAVAALALGALLRRAWAAILVAISTIALPYVLAALPLLPDDVAKGLLRLTPAAAFAIQQTVQEFPQVVAHYAPSAGYFPLPWWAGFAVLCGYTAVVVGLVAFRLRRQPAAASPESQWR